MLPLTNTQYILFCISILQFMSIHVHKMSLLLVQNDFNPNWMLFTTIGELHLDGSTLHNAKTLIVTAALNDAHVRYIRIFVSTMFRHAVLRFWLFHI